MILHNSSDYKGQPEKEVATDEVRSLGFYYTSITNISSNHKLFKQVIV